VQGASRSIIKEEPAQRASKPWPSATTSARTTIISVSDDNDDWEDFYQEDLASHSVSIRPLATLDFAAFPIIPTCSPVLHPNQELADQQSGSTVSPEPQLHNTPLPLSDEPTLIDSALEHATTPSSSPVPTITVRPKCHFSENGLVYPSNLAPESRGLLAIKSNTATAKVAALIPFRQEMTCRQWCF
jgi:hypothetical protein